jgi:hypothetical protein
MKSFKQFILMETPPPLDWDLDVFTKSYKKQIDYCVERASKLGSGSSRVVFEIEYEGRPTALKVAKNAKGLAQNERESDWGLYRMNSSITTPLIDFDEENDPPRWVHLEKASKLTASAFKSMTGFSFEDFGNILQNTQAEWKTGARENRTHGIDQDEIEKIEESELFSDVCNLMCNFGTLAVDLTRLANWGIYDGHPVIIDLGFDENVQLNHYSPKPRTERYR